MKYLALVVSFTFMGILNAQVKVNSHQNNDNVESKASLPDFGDDYDAKKEIWVKQNPDAYKSVLSQQPKSASTVIGFQKEDPAFKKAGNGDNNMSLDGFPIYKETGNVEQDNLDYLNAKQQWIDENPEIYKQKTQPNNDPK